MIELNSETFHLETKKPSVLLCIFYQGSINKAEEILIHIFPILEIFSWKIHSKSISFFPQK